MMRAYAKESNAADDGGIVRGRESVICGGNKTLRRTATGAFNLDSLGLHVVFFYANDRFLDNMRGYAVDVAKMVLMGYVHRRREKNV